MNAATAVSTGVVRDQTVILPAVLVERSKLRARALLPRRLDDGIAFRMRRVEELEGDIRRSQIPERHEVIETVGAAAIKARIVPPRANRIVATQPMPRQEADARVLVHIKRDGGVLFYSALYGERRLTQEFKIIDPDIVGIPGIGAVMYEERVAKRIVVVPYELSDALLIDRLPSTRGAPMYESIVDVEEMRPRCLALMREKEPVREVRRDQVWKLPGKATTVGSVPIGITTSTR